MPKAQAAPAGPVPAIPEGVRQLIERSGSTDVAPGHRFTLYFPIWDRHRWERAGDRARRDGLRDVAKSGEGLRDLTAALVTRHMRCAQALGDAVLKQEARNTSPFVTGLGMEHPVENGFAFLNPYGLPYLPGASVKGALRRAAETLALADSAEARRGWDLLAVWWLFGFDATARGVTGPEPAAPNPLAELARTEAEATRARATELDRTRGTEVRAFLRTVLDEREESRTRDLAHFIERLRREPALRASTHLRGALRFWDVIPKPENGNGLGIDILTPHHSGYYQGRNSPHNSENPIPNPFLVLEPGARFVFHVEFRPTHRCPERIREHWRELVEAAFAELFETAGFGAKTSVGYGVFEIDGSSRPEEELGSSRAREWIESQIRDLTRIPQIHNENDAYRGRNLAERWQSIKDETLKGEVLEALKLIWRKKNISPSSAARKIYKL